MHWYHWLIVVIPVFSVLWVSYYCRRFVNGVSEFLVAGRLAGRYMLLSAGMMGALSVLSFISNCEVQYNTGFAMAFWNNILMPVGLVMGLFGWISYRFRETRAMSAGQFLEMRYSKSFRIFAAFIRGTADMLANSIGPAIAARFFIYLLGLPFHFTLFGVSIPTFPAVLGVCILMATYMILTGGRLSLLVTDCLQGLISYPIFIILIVYIVTEFSWAGEISATMADRVSGESFLNPYDIQKLRDFNMFGLVVTVFNTFFGNAWIGNGYGTVAKTPHEGKMSGIIGNWHWSIVSMLSLLLVITVITVLNHERHAMQAHEIRQELSLRVMDDIAQSEKLPADVVERVDDAIRAMPVLQHPIGDAEPAALDNPTGLPVEIVRFETADHATGETSYDGLSREHSLDTRYHEQVRSALRENLAEEERGEKLAQNFRSLYGQQMLPLIMRRHFPAAITALVIMLMILLMVSTDDTRIFDSSCSFVQDFILPFFKKPPSPRFHLLMFKSMVCLVSVFFFIGSMFFTQLDYINMFVTIMCSIWTTGAGVVVTLGLYWRRGTTQGAFGALFTGGGLSVLGILVQRNWADGIVPWLLRHGWADGVRHFLTAVSTPFKPWIDWDVPLAEGARAFTMKFPINSTELSFIACIAALLVYVAVSLVTCRKPFNLERMLHRGIYNVNPDKVGVQEAKGKFTWKRLLNHFVDITPEYSKCDRILTWVVFFYCIVFQWVVVFLGIVVWNHFSPWTVDMWSRYFLLYCLVLPGVVGVITCVWFTIGGIADMKDLFRNLRNLKGNALDNGMVDGNVSLADKAVFAEREKESGESPE